jgi:phosphatidylglycerophosphate synthase
MLISGMASTLARDLRTTPNLITLSRIALLLVGTALYFSASPGLGNRAGRAGRHDRLPRRRRRARDRPGDRLGEILDQFCDLCFESLAMTVAVSVGFFPPYVLLLYLFREFW